MFCDPETLEALTPARDRTGAAVLRSPSGRVFQVRDGIPVFVAAATLTESERRQQRFYDRLAFCYDLGSAVHLLISRAARDWRQEYLDELAVQPGSCVLEVSVGTGANLDRLPPGQVFGLDLSWEMLQRCRRRNVKATLCQGQAERLPFASDAFDTVFHVGAINSFASKGRALAEMVRVARPGTRVLVVDATDKFAHRYRYVPIITAIYGRSPVPHAAPVEELPAGVEDVRVKSIAGGELYCLTFRKPALSRGPAVRC